LDLTPEQANGLRKDDYVRLHSKQIVQKAEAAKPSDLYTYRAEVLRVVDGDTLWMKIYLRPRHWLKEKLRLRGIDCPEMDTAEGKAAKKFVEALMTRVVSVTITTTKPDKWDRYLSDVFLETNSGEELFLNNLLLENGHAVRKDRFTLNDWENLG
jgi:micrococcal nuclease